jgi:uncharacterized protein
VEVIFHPVQTLVPPQDSASGPAIALGPPHRQTRFTAILRRGVCIAGVVLSRPSLLVSTLLIAFGTTLGVGLLSRVIPENYASTGVGFAFCAVTYWAVLRHEAAVIRAHGLALGGLLLPEPLDARRLFTAALNAGKWCALSAGIWFPLFLGGYLLWWRPSTTFHLRPGEAPIDELFAQVLAIALPEEMFYRGFLQSRLDKVWPPRLKLLGAEVGYGLLVSSLIFAAGHLVTTPDVSRLAVFFPSLMFGWLRARTGGIGAAVAFHAACNLLTAYLGRGFDFFL